MLCEKAEAKRDCGQEADNCEGFSELSHLVHWLRASLSAVCLFFFTRLINREPRKTAALEGGALIWTRVFFPHTKKGKC